MDDVKTLRQTRAQRTQQTRRRMVESAHRLFVTNGYAATTMGQIAAAADVAVQTVYYTFGTKGQLAARGRRDDRLGWAGPGALGPIALGRGDARGLGPAAGPGPRCRARHRDLRPRRALVADGRGRGETDVEVEHYWRGVAARRNAAQRAMAARLVELGPLRAGLDVDRAGDLVGVLLGHDVYRGLVLEAGWAPSDYRAWAFSMLVEQLLGVSTDAAVTRDLSFAAP